MCIVNFVIHRWQVRKRQQEKYEEAARALAEREKEKEEEKRRQRLEQLENLVSTVTH